MNFRKKPSAFANLASGAIGQEFVDLIVQAVMGKSEVEL